MRSPLPTVLAAALLAAPLPSPASEVGRTVAVDLVLDTGRSLALFPVQTPGHAYAEALKGANYRIRVRNLTPRRVGLCIAVDGRNILTGGQSWLKNNESLYILGPWEEQSYEGWRTGQDRVNRFTFTSAGESYAAAFGDTTAMGVVALAVFPEVQPVRWPLRKGEPPVHLDAEASRACPAPAAKEEAGTGYGAEAYSPTRQVAFRAEASPWEQIFIKYEWRDTLKRLGVIKDAPPANRFWSVPPGDGPWCPPPPARRP